MIVGYARVSTEDQTLEAQIEALTAAGCERVYAEKQSGASTDERAELALMLSNVREGDVVLVTKLDRLARSMVDLTQIVASLQARGVGFRCIHQAAIDTTSITGRLMLNILGSFAEFERDLIAERRREGIVRAKLAGKYRGRPRATFRETARALRMEEPHLTAPQIARRLNLGLSTVYRFTAGMWP